jgi:hypothetical protein
VEEILKYSEDPLFQNSCCDGKWNPNMFGPLLNILQQQSGTKQNEN